MDFDKTFWPSAADMDALRQEDDWQRVAEEHFSVDNIRKYFARSPPLSAQDVDGWRPRGIIRNHMVIHSESHGHALHFGRLLPRS